MTTRITLPVEGMSCTGCENNIQFALTSLGGVDTADADHEAKTVQVDYDPETTSSDELRQAIEDMGYRIVSQ
jgi:copper chaperone